jgi:phosphoribosyl 1,2-cyclic phosphate phosphodiesterase
MKGEALFLGTGGSMGTPVIGCHCSVCKSSSPFNHRLRPSLLLTVENRRYLFDIGPDFRLQALKYGIEEINGVILTHSHYDHIGGLDELRIFYFRKQLPLPFLVSAETFEEIKLRYHYMMPSVQKQRAYPVQFDFQVLQEDQGFFEFENLPLSYFSYEQKGMKVTGVRIKDFAYVVDILTYPTTIFQSLKGVKTLVIDGTAWERTAAHLGITEIIEFAKKVGCKRTYLTHIAHEIDHEKVQTELPDGVQLAYDGLKLKLW